MGDGRRHEQGSSGCPTWDDCACPNGEGLARPGRSPSYDPDSILATVRLCSRMKPGMNQRPRPPLPIWPPRFQPQNHGTPGQAPVVAPAARFPKMITRLDLLDELVYSQPPAPLNTPAVRPYGHVVGFREGRLSNVVDRGDREERTEQFLPGELHARSGGPETTIGENQFPSMLLTLAADYLARPRDVDPERFVEAGRDVIVDDWTHERVGWLIGSPINQFLRLLDDLGGEVVGDIAVRRRPGGRRWTSRPDNPNAERTIPLAAASRSARGPHNCWVSRPPISASTGRGRPFGVERPRMYCQPTSADPVNATPSTSVSARARPMSRTAALATDAAGSTSARIEATAEVDRGVLSNGLQMMVLPATKCTHHHSGRRQGEREVERGDDTEHAVGNEYVVGVLGLPRLQLGCGSRRSRSSGGCSA